MQISVSFVLACLALVANPILSAPLPQDSSDSLIDGKLFLSDPKPTDLPPASLVIALDPLLDISADINILKRDNKGSYIDGIPVVGPIASAVLPPLASKIVEIPVVGPLVTGLTGAIIDGVPVVGPLVKNLGDGLDLGPLVDGPPKAGKSRRSLPGFTTDDATVPSSGSNLQDFIAKVEYEQQALQELELEAMQQAQQQMDDTPAQVPTTDMGAMPPQAASPISPTDANAIQPVLANDGQYYYPAAGVQAALAQYGQPNIPPSAPRINIASASDESSMSADTANDAFSSFMSDASAAYMSATGAFRDAAPTPTVLDAMRKHAAVSGVPSMDSAFPSAAPSVLPIDALQRPDASGFIESASRSFNPAASSFVASGADARPTNFAKVKNTKSSDQISGVISASAELSVEGFASPMNDKHNSHSTRLFINNADESLVSDAIASASAFGSAIPSATITNQFAAYTVHHVMSSASAIAAASLAEPSLGTSASVLAAVPEASATS